MSSLKQFYDVLKEEGYIKINPLNNLESFKKIKNLPKSLSEEQLILLLKKAKNNFKNFEKDNSSKKIKYLRILTILEILYSTGMRVSELISLPLSDFIKINDIEEEKRKTNIFYTSLSESIKEITMRYNSHSVEGNI